MKRVKLPVVAHTFLLRSGSVLLLTHYNSPTGEGIDFFLSATRWAGELFPRTECDDLRWCPLDALPVNTIPFVRRAIEHHLQRGQWFDEIGWEQ